MCLVVFDWNLWYLIVLQERFHCTIEAIGSKREIEGGKIEVFFLPPGSHISDFTPVWG